ncbi:replicative DNA helicase [candidate division WWE3 bacterium RIFCSPHIGHO2_12_FULL_38_15]|uniref:Replicative DNA helicase n=1 Tax=candidate division WWE3 bacterium RIFCSPHIGHO2_02_FULL_38_14 TaxID=1802620 RepID=A0A1F4V6J4_UNCKA|nr:MAG: replicative DNA helicase [candidate division WWE3 bacterium RIFCSPHIGHO2_01_FULL_38_45]OGC48886.1 MAG: replicative DNA helicase [candidate division WWE3 bacterium RIFCSPHIGHO2_12_FULL_38_15]OGC52818.1 MAG: replicative DNA helicase [candidate division WWE3 bacterium RIFCSPHIGHO2_02_FULL_38_14]OGC53191.1 MAG: replicative DNA helicase [candidate division WWE3 bacterium RIFCSPLOWO2_01_FULL_37_24]HLB52003.1 replicative DNA helicase [Patescibacteria group bacterium]
MPAYTAKDRTPSVGIPPHDLEAEKSILGALLLDKDAIVKVVETLRSSHFYKSSHEKIYDAMLTLYEKREPIDLITVPAELKRMGELESSGGVTYLTELVNSVPTAANVEFYARMVSEDYVKRSVMKAASEISELVYKESNVDELLDQSEQLLFSVSQQRVHQDFVPVKETLGITFERLDELSKTRGALRGVPTGLAGLDKMLSGLQRENLVILAARPSVGKSSFAINIAQFAAVSHKVSVGIFSLEMGRESIVDRMISVQGDIDNWRITTGNLEQEDFEKYGIAAGELSEAPIFIDDTPGIGVMEMRTKARRLQLEHDLGLIIVDYLQLIRGRNLESRVQEVSEISQALKNLARELKIPVLAVSQLSRAVEQRGGEKRPQLSDLRDSGSIEQDADVVMFLYRPNDEDRENYKLLLAKHRNGPTGEISLFFKADRTKFFEVEAQRGE